MPGLELPLIGPSGGSELQPSPVVAPQNEGFNKIAEAGNRLTGDAMNLWYMNRMARLNEQDAKLAASSGAMETASTQTRTAALTHPELQPGDMPKFYSDGMAKARDVDLANPGLCAIALPQSGTSR
jgi:hypothetical protein